MSERQLRLVGLLGNTITFADPLKVTDTTRFDQTVQNVKQSKDGFIFGIQRNEMVSLKNVCVSQTGCGDFATTQQASVRIKVNSPLASSAEVKQQVLDALDNYKAAIENGLLDGLKPNTNSVLKVDVGVV